MTLSIQWAEVAELADALASGASGLNARAGSSPVLQQSNQGKGLRRKP